MPTENAAGRQKSAARGPLLLALLLLLALAGALYLLHSRNVTEAQWRNAQLLTQENDRTAALQAEKARLEGWLRQSPCTARDLLRKEETARPAAPASGKAPASAAGTGAGTAAAPSSAHGKMPAAAGSGAETPAASAGNAAGTPAAPASGKAPAAPAPAPTGAAATPAATAAEAADPAALLERACVFIVCTDGKGSLSTGSGFFVAEGHIITNDHVVNKAVGRILITSRALGTPVQGTLVAHTSENGRDYALLRVTMPQGIRITAPAFAAAARRTDKIGTWGFPHVIGQNDPAYAKLMSGSDISAVPELAYSEGVVSAVLQRTPPLVVHTAPISPGNSGGPLVNAKGEIVGINTMITLDEDSYRQASIALAGSDLLTFLQSCGITAAVSAQ